MHIPSSIKHYWQVRPRLLLSVGAGILCYLLLPATLSELQRLMLGWNVLAWCYLLFLWRLMLISTQNTSANWHGHRMRAPVWCWHWSASVVW
jgi:uncharacterized membrane protein